MAGLGVTALIELPPAGTLTGLAKRTLPGVTLLAVKTPEQLDAARELIESCAGHPVPGHLPEWRLVVAPTSGRFRAPAAGDGAGTVVTRGGEHPLAVPPGYEILEWLAEDGDPVSAGQPLIRVQPLEEA
jgi:[acyl-carrier-protein] S-malonyltransferase